MIRFSTGRQLAQPRAAARGEVDDLARLGTAEVFGRDPIALEGHVIADEVDVASADVRHGGEDAAAAEELDLQALARRAELEEVVDQAFHGVGAIAGGEADRRIEPVVGADRGVLRQHEVIHAAEAACRIAHASGHTGAEHGGDRLVAAAHVVLAREDLDHPAGVLAIPEALEMLEAAQHRRQLAVAGRCSASRARLGVRRAGEWFFR